MKKERGMKNWFKEKFSVMISLLLISCCLIPATFSKYTQKITQHINLSVIQAIGYFTAYDGETSFFGNTDWDAATIKTFSRDTTSTESQVLAKTGVTVISNTLSDGYTSPLPVYGYVDASNNFKWWSACEVVYFHPETLHAFRDMAEVTTIDFNGTRTHLVQNFAHWFDKDRKLTTINGTINTSGLVLEYNPNYNYDEALVNEGENTSSGLGLAFMFNDCNALRSVDLSQFVTTNASDMKRMFGGCNSLQSIDLSHFDTSNVKSMYWMFRAIRGMSTIDLSSFDTSNVVNMIGMFTQSTSLKTIQLGPNWDTPNVKRFDNMFSGTNALTTIWAYKDFVSNVNPTGSNMFSNDTALAGGLGSPYATVYSTSNRTHTYAKLANASHPGYFTLDLGSTKYTISYNLSNGTVSTPNPIYYFEESPTITLINPTKSGYTFIGWTGSNGNTPQLTLTIPTGSTGNRSYVANFEYDLPETFPIVFQISGTCTFNGSTANITSANNSCKAMIGDNLIDFTQASAYGDGHYIDTNVFLYNTANKGIDYEIYFEIDEFAVGNQETGNTQQVFMNTKYENAAINWPGLVFRRNGNNLEVTQNINGAKKNKTWAPGAVQTVSITREDGIVYYSINGAARTQLQDMNAFNQDFDIPVWFGAAPDANGDPFRHIKATISNMYIKMGDYHA